MDQAALLGLIGGLYDKLVADVAQRVTASLDIDAKIGSLVGNRVESIIDEMDLDNMIQEKIDGMNMDDAVSDALNNLGFDDMVKDAVQDLTFDVSVRR